jgi:uncharacterized protein YdeI (YjbR/CyaY-like superfamily)
MNVVWNLGKKYLNQQKNIRMEMRNLLEVESRSDFRQWLSGNSSIEKECWVKLKHEKDKSFGGIYYIDAVEEAICFGWIDGIVKKISEGVIAHRFTPRSSKSVWSELNKERARRMEKLGKMTDAGRAVLPDMSPSGFVIDEEILAALRADESAYETFLSFPPLYQRVRIDTIQRDKRNPELFQNRLQKFIEKTGNKIMYGKWNGNERLIDY